MEEQKTRILYFSSPWCGPCKLQGPIIDKLIEEGVVIEKIDVGTKEGMAMAESYSLLSTPSIVIANLQDDKSEVFKTLTGVNSSEVIKKYVE